MLLIFFFSALLPSKLSAFDTIYHSKKDGGMYILPYVAIFFALIQLVSKLLPFYLVVVLVILLTNKISSLYMENWWWPSKKLGS
jgi:glucan phosphoethanolaminetransferase (alkaline phosphatase superfamily)